MVCRYFLTLGRHRTVSSLPTELTCNSSFCEAIHAYMHVHKEIKSDVSVVVNHKHVLISLPCVMAHPMIFLTSVIISQRVVSAKTRHIKDK